MDCSAGTFRWAFSNGNERRAIDTALTMKGSGESCFRCLPSSSSFFCFLLASRRRSALNLVKSTVSVYRKCGMASERVILLNICCWIGVRGMVWGVFAAAAAADAVASKGGVLRDELFSGLGVDSPSDLAAAVEATCRCTSSFNTCPSRPVPWMSAISTANCLVRCRTAGVASLALFVLF